MCAFAAACAADRVKLTYFTMIRDRQAFLDKINRRFAVGHGGKIGVPNIAEQIFIGTIEVAGINVPIAFRNELARAAPQDTALLGLLPQKEPHPVVELPHADILSARIILDIEVKDFD